MEEATTSAAAQIAQTGILGALLILALGYIYYLSRQHNEVQNKRVEDQRLMSEKLLGLSDSHNDAMAGVKEALVAQKGAITSLEGVVSSLSSDIRELEREARNA